MTFRLFFGDLTSPSGQCRFIFHESTNTHKQRHRVGNWDSIATEMFLVTWVSPIAKHEWCFISWGHVVDDFIFPPPHVIGVVFGLTIFLLLIFLVCEKQALCAACLSSIFNYIWITDRHYHRTSELPGTHFERELPRRGSCANINRIDSMGRLKARRPRNPTSARRKKTWKRKIRFVGTHDALWKFNVLNFNENRNRILITCTLFCRLKEKGEQSNFRKETKETTNLIKMHYAF